MNDIGSKKLAARRSVGLPCLVLASMALAQPPENNPQELVRRVIQNELKAELQDDSHWMLRLETENKNGQKEVDEVVETKNGDLKRPIVLGGRELTAQERKESDARLGQNPRELRKSLAAKNQDAVRSQQMLQSLPDALVFSYGERRGDLVQLNFKPNPRFHSTTHEQQVFHAMEGSVWVDQKENRLAEISGRLTKKVRFGGGLLGYLEKGGTFDVKQQEVSPGYWEVTRLDVQMKGKALFFKTIGAYLKHSRSEFKRVPDNLTIAQAAEMLKRQSAPQTGEGHTM